MGSRMGCLVRILHGRIFLNRVLGVKSADMSGTVTIFSTLRKYLKVLPNRRPVVAQLLVFDREPS